MSDSSKLTAYMETAKADLESNVEGIGTIFLMDRKAIQEVVAESQARTAGQAVSFLPTGAQNPQPGVKNIKLVERIRVEIFDIPQLRKKHKRQVNELREDIMKRLHSSNNQSLKSACHDSRVVGYAIEDQIDASIHVINLEVDIHHTS